MSRSPGSVTVIDVAREAGVSKSAAARVLAESGSASAATRKKVLAAAKKLGYRPNQLARAIKSGTTHLIGAVLPDVSSPFFSAVLHGLSEAARTAGFEVLVSNTDNDPAVESRSLDLLAQQRVSGIIIAPTFTEHPKALLDLASEGLPIVLLDRAVPALLNLPLVSLDHASATERAVETLLELGHRRIAIVNEAAPEFDRLIDLDDREGALQTLKPSAQRLYGYFRALAKEGITPERRFVIDSDYTSESAELAMHAFIDSGLPATAVHCTDSVLSYGAYRALTRRGIAIPERLSFIGFDDPDWTTLVQPAVSVVNQPRHRLGTAAFATLLDHIRGNDPEERTHLMPGELIMRGTTAPPADS